MLTLRVRLLWCGRSPVAPRHPRLGSALSLGMQYFCPALPCPSPPPAPGCGREGPSPSPLSDKKFGFVTRRAVSRSTR